MARRDVLRGLAAYGVVVAAGGCASSAGDGATATSAAPTTGVPKTAQPTTGPPTTVPLTAVPPTAGPPTAVQPVTTAEATTTVAPIVGPAKYVNHATSGRAEVALTFHLGGEAALVAELLDVLRDRSVPSTLFAIGSWLTANPALARQAVADRHELANHTQNHRSMGSLDASQISEEIVQCGETLVPLIGSIGRYFRPSATTVPSQLILDEAGKAGYALTVGYDVDSLDFTGIGSRAVATNVLDPLHPGAIVSLHFGYRDTIDAMPAILGGIASSGLDPVTITDLLRP